MDGKRIAIGLAVIAVLAVAGAFLLAGPKNKTGFAALLSGIDENVLYKSITPQLVRAVVTDSNGSIEATGLVRGQDANFAEIYTDQNSAKGQIEVDFNAELPESAAVDAASLTISYGLSTQKALAAAVGGPAGTENQTGNVIILLAIVAGAIIVAMVVYFMVILPKG